jgi:hypothetical protein
MVRTATKVTATARPTTSAARGGTKVIASTPVAVDDSAMPGKPTPIVRTTCFGAQIVS